MRRLLLQWCLGWVCAAAHAQPWPEAAVPDGAIPFVVMENGVINGIPSRITGLESRQSAADLAAWLQRRLPKEQRTQDFPAKTVISALDGRFMHTVIVESRDGGGSTAIHSVTRLPSAAEKNAYQQQKSHWLNAMPSGTRITAHQSSVDGVLQSTQVVLINPHPLALGLQRVLQKYRQQGFVPADETVAVLRGLQRSGSKQEALVQLSHPRGDEVIVTGGMQGLESWLVVHQTTRLERLR